MERAEESRFVVRLNWLVLGIKKRIAHILLADAMNVVFI